jgi:hypothetical protein
MMGKSIFRINAIHSIVIVLVLASFSGCSRFIERIVDHKAGINGSFEISAVGLPVNWSIYTQKVVPEGDFDIILDTTDFRDGKQSLKFQVRKCLPHGGWHSPGIFQEITAEPGDKFLVSWWQKNSGCAYKIVLTSYNTDDLKDEQFLGFFEVSDTIQEWQKFESLCTLAVRQNQLRFQLNILSPGTFWIDGFQIEKKQ